MSINESIKTFWFLDGREGSVLDTYRLDELAGALIVRDEVAKKFLVFQNHEECFNALAATKTTPTWHEVILKDMPQRLRFDIDINVDEEFEKMIPRGEVMARVMSRSEIREICSTCGYPFGSCDVCAAIPKIMKNSNDMRAEYILEEILDAYRRVLPGIDYIICSSHSSNFSSSSGLEISKRQKYSYHVITYAWSPNSHHIHHLCEEIGFLLSPQIRRYYDSGVCSNGTHNLRLCGSVKIGTTRIKISELDNLFENQENLQIRDFDLWRETLVTYISIFCRKVVSKVAPPIEPVIHRIGGAEITGDVSELLELVKPYHEGLVFSHTKGIIISYRRVHPSICFLCKRIHDSENSFYIVRHSNYLRLKCRRALPTEGISLPIPLIPSSSCDE